MPRKKQVPQFEQALSDLEALVEQMESGELTLEQSLQTFEQGIRLTQDCQNALTQAQQKVAMLQTQSDQNQPPNQDNCE